MERNSLGRNLKPVLLPSFGRGEAQDAHQHAFIRVHTVVLAGEIKMVYVESDGSEFSQNCGDWLKAALEGQPIQWAKGVKAEEIASGAVLPADHAFRAELAREAMEKAIIDIEAHATRGGCADC